MAQRCYLYIGSDVFLESAWNIPPYWMLLFAPDDKVIEKGEAEKIYYRSSVGKVKTRLDSIGLSIERLQNAVKKLSIVADEVVDYVPIYLSEEKNRVTMWETGEETDIPEDIDFLLSELEDEPRYSPIGHLWLLRLRCDCLDNKTEIALDPNEVVEMWDIENLKEVDLHSELLEKFAEEIDTYNQLFQMVLMPIDDFHLLRILRSLKEDELINNVVVPMLEEMGFKCATSVAHHGPGELGKDIKPFYVENIFGIREYYAVQAKALKIHSKSGKKGHVNEVIDQMKTALRMPFIDPTDNSEKKIDHFLIITSHDITADARRQIEETVQGRREIMLIDGQMLVKLLRKCRDTFRSVILKFSPK